MCIFCLPDTCYQAPRGGRRSCQLPAEAKGTLGFLFTSETARTQPQRRLTDGVHGPHGRSQWKQTSRPLYPTQSFWIPEECLLECGHSEHLWRAYCEPAWRTLSVFFKRMGWGKVVICTSYTWDFLAVELWFAACPL